MVSILQSELHYHSQHNNNLFIKAEKEACSTGLLFLNLTTIHFIHLLILKRSNRHCYLNLHLQSIELHHH